MRREDLSLQALDWLRFPLAVIIVCDHTFNVLNFTIKGNPISTENVPAILELNHLFSAFFRLQCVPIFFFISGFLFFWGVRFTREVYLQKLKKRVKGLLVPYVLWNLFYLLFFLLLFLPCFSAIFPNIHNAPLDFSLTAIINTFWDGSQGVIVSPGAGINREIYPLNIPLWFVRDLMIVVLFTPAIYVLLVRMGKWLVMVLGLVWFVMEFRDFGHLNQLLTATFFFTWGAYMSVKNRDLIRVFGRYSKSSLVLYITLGVVYFWAAHSCPCVLVPVKSLNIVAGLFFAYNLSVGLLSKHCCKVSSFLSSSSFFIYVAHMVICRDFVRVYFLLFHPLTQCSILFVYLLSAATTVLSLLSLYYLLRRYTPGFLRVITGRF